MSYGFRSAQQCISAPGVRCRPPAGLVLARPLIPKRPIRQQLALTGCPHAVAPRRWRSVCTEVERSIGSVWSCWFLGDPMLAPADRLSYCEAGFSEMGAWRSMRSGLEVHLPALTALRV